MAQVMDPVCSMTVDTETARFRSEYEGKTYYFCAAGCKREFDENPAAFAGNTAHEMDMGSAASGSGPEDHGAGH